ncbi:MAG: carboxypeptidase M32 [Bacteroidetes bacterium]|nr:carboxypeptidase M32 [Bacteroidota bacterium]MDA0875637.1 carboxypeptidase M32 [Bacteroidota bacterium]
MQDLRDRLTRITHLGQAAAILEWDMETYMPEGGADARASQVATLRSMAHELLTANETVTLLENARPESDIDLDLVRIVKRDVAKATKVPSKLVAAMAEAAGRAKGAWQKARATNDFPLFAPHLERIVDLSRQHADALGYADQPYDALLDQYEEGASTRQVADVFEKVRLELVPIVQAIQAAAPLDESPVHRAFPLDRQWSFGLDMVQRMGYDLHHGRQDVSTHPFSTSFSISDVRITTRSEEHFFNPAFFGTLHEAGHAMYEQGIDRALEGLPLADGTSLGIHESQSRMWENLVGRSRAFWTYAWPLARQTFPESLANTTQEDFYRAINAVKPSTIRVEADEVTYNLHIMLRFELEQEIISGRIAIKDLPEAWNERMVSWLGVRPESDTEGVLQDIHWSLGAIGYFPTYALGNLMSVQLFEAARRDLGDLEGPVSRGDFAPLLGWLRTNVHQWGRRRSADEILRSATGSPLSAEPWLAYARAKFGNLYGF